jgi:hypothetical protein
MLVVGVRKLGVGRMGQFVGPGTDKCAQKTNVIEELVALTGIEPVFKP